jgi:hypothetical protein
VRDEHPPSGDPQTEAELRRAHAARLHQEVASMNTDNFVVRPKRQLVEHYRKPEAWDRLAQPKSVFQNERLGSGIYRAHT